MAPTRSLLVLWQALIYPAYAEEPTWRLWAKFWTSASSLLLIANDFSYK